MVFVKVRETYDLATVKNRMTLISVHTPRPDIIKRNFPGLLMQCKAYRPYSCDVRIACASVQPLDPLGVGTAEGDVAPEDVFNPILYKAMTNVGLSQLEARITAMSDFGTGGVDVDGASAAVDVDTNTPISDEFNVYYGLLSNAHGWKHAAPQSGLSMTDLRPLVHEMLYNVADSPSGQLFAAGGNSAFAAPNSAGNVQNYAVRGIRGNPKPLPFMNCTSYTYNGDAKEGEKATTGYAAVGFTFASDTPYNSELDVPWVNCTVAALVIPPSRLHQLFYRMVVEWTLEFSGIRPISEITNYVDLAKIGNSTHFQNYSYSAVKEAVTGDPESMLDSDSCMVSANVDVKKVM